MFTTEEATKERISSYEAALQEERKGYEARLSHVQAGFEDQRLDAPQLELRIKGVDSELKRVRALKPKGKK